MRVSLAFLLPLTVLLLACGDGTVTTGEDGDPPRYARRFVPFDPEWIPESEVPEEPQRRPQMVIWELTETLEEPGEAEHRAAEEWVERCYAAAERHGWYDFEKGRADGFERPPADPRHYQNLEHLRDGVILDPDRPEFLMYYPGPDGNLALAGFMFFTNDARERGPQFAGMLTLWHYHVFARPRCVLERGMVSLGFRPLNGPCPEGEPQHRSPEMIHTWLIDHPQGPFATSMMLPPEVVLPGLAKRLEERGF